MLIMLSGININQLEGGPSVWLLGWLVRRRAG